MLSGKRIIWLLGAFIILPLLVYQNLGRAAEQKNDQVKIEKEPNSDLSTLTLTPKAAERLDIKTTKVREEPVERDDLDDVKEKGGVVLKRKVVIPYSALLYDANGKTWVYTNPKPLTYIRYPIKIDDIEDDGYIVLADGPPLGTEVVTIGVSELYGAEKGIGK